MPKIVEPDRFGQTGPYPPVLYQAGKACPLWIRSKMYLEPPNRNIENSFCNSQRLAYDMGSPEVEVARG